MYAHDLGKGLLADLVLHHQVVRGASPDINEANPMLWRIFTMRGGRPSIRRDLWMRQRA
jgi:hypothetical protein